MHWELNRKKKFNVIKHKTYPLLSKELFFKDFELCMIKLCSMYKNKLFFVINKSTR